MNDDLKYKRYVSERKEIIIEDWYNQVLMSKDTHYLILKHLTTSGLGEIFLSITSDNYLVILKIFMENRYLETEIELTKLVNKKEDCILPFLDYFIIDFNGDKYYIVVLKFFEGWITLEQHLNKCLFYEEQKLFFQDKIRVILQKIHKYSIVHNDLDKNKILVHPKINQIRLIDLGFCIYKISRKISDEEFQNLINNDLSN